jgi:folylpolyglutamate synthase
MHIKCFSEAVVDIFERLTGKAEIPGLFRFMTLMAFDQMLKLHKRGGLDVAILEVGMGGRYDSTNIVERPVVTAISSLSMEHVRSLGPTLVDIAGHKVGIAKRNVPLLSVPQPVAAVDVMCDYVAKANVPLSFIENLSAELPMELNDLNLGIEGEHQRLNAALATRICKVWWDRVGPTEISLSPSLILKGLQTTSWPGRHQIHREADRIWYLDGAHTIESIGYALDWFKHHKIDSHDQILIFHVSHDRPFDKLLDPISELQKATGLFSAAYFVKPQSPTDTGEEAGCLTLHQKMAEYWTFNTKTLAHVALSQDLSSIIPKERLLQILACGSLYLVGEMMRILNIPIP